MRKAVGIQGPMRRRRGAAGPRRLRRRHRCAGPIPRRPEVSFLSRHRSRRGRAAASWTSPCPIWSATRSTRRPAPAACGSRSTTASPGSRSSITSGSSRSATSPSRRPTRTSSGWARGEANTSRSTYWGDGMYKSTDAGKTCVEHGPQRHPSHRPHRDSPEEPRHRLRRGARTPVLRERGARRVQDDRWREDVDQVARRQAERQGDRRRPTS